jgi:hypothetical protein
MSSELLLNTLRALEIELHKPSTRANVSRLGKLLHPLFRELSRSGRQYSREEVLAEFSKNGMPYEIHSQDYQVEPLAKDLALLTYRSAHSTASGALDRYSLRASLWQLTDDGWQLRFHQGTPSEAFGRTWGEDS